MSSIDGGTSSYSNVFLAAATVEAISARTVTVTGDAVFYDFHTGADYTATSGTTLATLFACEEGEMGIITFTQNSFTGFGIGGMWVYSYTNGAGNVYMLHAFDGTNDAVLSFSGANLQGNNAAVSLFWRKVRIN